MNKCASYQYPVWEPSFHTHAPVGECGRPFPRFAEAVGGGTVDPEAGRGLGITQLVGEHFPHHCGGLGFENPLPFASFTGVTCGGQTGVIFEPLLSFH